MFSLSEFRQSRWLIAASCLLLLAGCKAPKPKATTPLWETVDSGFHNEWFAANSLIAKAQRVDASGNSWQSVKNSADGHSLRLVDASGNEQWRISLASPVPSCTIAAMPWWCCAKTAVC